EDPLRLGRIADKQINFGWPFVTRIVSDVLLPVETNVSEGSGTKFAHGVCFVCRQNEIVSFILLQHSPHAFDIFRGITPVAFRFEIAEKQFVLEPILNRGHGSRDFARYKGFPAAWAFVVKQNPVTRAESVAFAIIDRRPIGENFRYPIWAPRPEPGRLGL